MSRAIPLFRKMHIGATLKTRNKHQLEKWRRPGNYCQRKPRVSRVAKTQRESNVDSGFDTWQPENRAGIATGKSPVLSP